MFTLRLLLLIFLALHSTVAFTQQGGCGTRTPATALFVDQQKLEQQRMVFSTPLLVKVFVHITANTDGTQRAVEDTTMMRQLKNMQQLYASHGICFLLVGMEQINSTDLAVQDHSEELELVPFLVPDAIDIFVHRTLTDGSSSLNGTAYSVLNDYLSLDNNAVNSIDNISTLAHEMGHCFGLYHTFEDAFGVENISRGACANCTTAGDLLCDTEADPQSDSYDPSSDINAACNYIGNARQICNNVSLTYQMDPRNVMSYGRRECRSLFTSGQGTRAKAIILTTTMLINCLAEDNLTVSNSQSVSTGRLQYAVRDNLTIDATTFSASGSARVNLKSGNSVTLSPGVSLTPTGSAGYVWVGISTLCR